jgi:formylglycine-generating enzyme required for sulfatase activity
MKPKNAHKKETILILVGTLIFLALVFGGIVLLRTGLIGTPFNTAIPTKNVGQVIQEMHGTITAQAISTQQALFNETATCVALTANAPTVTFTPTPTVEPPLGSSKVSPIDGMNQIYVPSGNFLMGSTDDFSEAELQEKPQHTVYLDGFWMDQTEVSQGMFKRCIASGTCSELTHDFEQNPNYTNTEYDNHPVIYITWDQAKIYCERVGRRLPTEAEWEKAARGTADGRLFPWGDTPPDGTKALFGNALNGTRPVGSYPAGASPYGILDMIGNVREWVFDIYSETYYRTSPDRNPPGSEETDYLFERTLRGASYKDAIHNTHLSMRFHHVANSPGENRGFRCASSD